MTSSALRRLADVLAMHEALKYSRICSTTSFASPKVSWTEVPRPSSSSVALVCPRDEMTASERSTSSSARHSGSHSVPLGRRSMLFCIGIMATAAAAIELLEHLRKCAVAPKRRGCVGASRAIYTPECRIKEFLLFSGR